MRSHCTKIDASRRIFSNIHMAGTSALWVYLFVEGSFVPYLISLAFRALSMAFAGPQRLSHPLDSDMVTNATTKITRCALIVLKLINFWTGAFSRQQSCSCCVWDTQKIGWTHCPPRKLQLLTELGFHQCSHVL